MRKSYRRKAWLLDDGILLVGYTSKGKFFPNSFACGFIYELFRKKDIGKTIFFNEKEVLAMNLEICE